MIVDGNNILDSSSNELVKTSATASAVNEITVTNAATGGRPTISATGGDTDIGVEIAAKGAGQNSVASNVPASNTIGGVLLVHRFDISDAASGDSDITLTHKERVIDAHVVKTGGAGAASNTYTVKNGATAITNAMDGNVADQAIVRAATIDDAQHAVSAAGTLRVSWAKSGGNVAAIVYVTTIRVA